MKGNCELHNLSVMHIGRKATVILGRRERIGFSNRKTLYKRGPPGIEPYNIPRQNMKLVYNFNEKIPTIG